MDIRIYTLRDFRKFLFLNSQYCTYYLDNKKTVLAGIMRNIGYKYSNQLDDETIQKINKTYRKYTIIINCIVGFGILFYLYTFLFPYFTKFIEMPYFIIILLLSMIPLVVLYLIFITINYFYEKFLCKNIGEFEKVTFKPNIYNIEPKAFNHYLNASHKSVYVLLFMISIFVGFLSVPIITQKMNNIGKYNYAIKLANTYLKIIPISADMYADRALAKRELKDYEGAIKDYELANKYSGSNLFDLNILSVKMAYLPFDKVISILDSEIIKADNNDFKNFLINEKAIYLHNNKKYKEAIKIYDNFINQFYTKKEVGGFDINEIHYFRANARKFLGDLEGSKKDMIEVNKRCKSCDYKIESKLLKY